MDLGAARDGGWARRVPASAYFGVSAVFHYLGPSAAVLLFAHLDALGVAWLRIASAAAVFALWRQPWRMLKRLGPGQRGVMAALGVVLAAMNCVFYLAVARLPLSTVGSVEFLGVIGLAAAGVRGWRNGVALGLAVLGVFTLADVRLVAQPVGFVFAFANCVLFVAYVITGHRIANDERDGIDQLGAAMLLAAIVVTPVGIGGAAPAFVHPGWLLAGVAVGICSSVIPYVTDQLAMARLRRSTFALMLSILPAAATVIGVLVLKQIPTPPDLIGVALVIAGIAVHQPSKNDTRRDDGIRSRGHLGTEGLADRPGNDELRQPRLGRVDS